MEKPFSERFRVAFGAHAHRGATEVPHRRANRTGALGEFDVAQRFAVAVAAAVFLALSLSPLRAQLSDLSYSILSIKTIECVLCKC